MTTVGHFIGGEDIIAGSRTQAIFNPSTGEQCGEVELAPVAPVEQAMPMQKLLTRYGVILRQQNVHRLCSVLRCCWKKKPMKSVS